MMCVDYMYYQATLEEITSKGDSIQVIQNIGQEVMSQCSPQDKDDIQQKLKEITTNFADVEDMAKLHLEDLNEERVKAEDYEKQGADLDDWLKGKEAIVEQWEEFAIDSATLEQQMEKIGVSCSLVIGDEWGQIYLNHKTDMDAIHVVFSCFSPKEYFG